MDVARVDWMLRTGGHRRHAPQRVGAPPLPARELRGGRGLVPARDHGRRPHRLTPRCSVNAAAEAIPLVFMAGACSLFRRQPDVETSRTNSLTASDCVVRFATGRWLATQLAGRSSIRTRPPPATFVRGITFKIRGSLTV